VRVNGAGFELGDPEHPNGKPLYRLHQLATRPTDPVVVCEGEWCTDALAKAGVLATTSGGADSAEKADWRPLAGRCVTIWPDNDEAGRRYAQEVTEKLLTQGCTVRVIDVGKLGLPKKGDAVDWLAANPAATAADIARISHQG
jgi:putative DNA primase/helicase